IQSTRVRTMPIAGSTDPSPYANPNRTLTAYMKCVRTCTNGAAIGLIPLTTPSPPTAIHVDPNKAPANLLAEDHGGTTSRSHAAPLAPASRPNSNTPTT